MSGRPGPAAPPVEVFVAPDGNAFMTDIAAWVVEAAVELGRDARLIHDGSLPEPSSPALPIVIAPHEFFELSDRPVLERRTAATRSVLVATEQPGTSWFERSLDWCRRAPRVLDINPAGAEALRSAGVDASWLRLGAVASMDRRSSADERDVDVTVLAGLTEHRERVLAALAPTLWSRRAELRLVPNDRPLRPSAGNAGSLFGPAKYELLARSRLLLNLHRDERTTYFEWARIVEAMANGCVVVTEPSSSITPLVDGEHLVVTDDPASTVDRLLGDLPAMDAIGTAAADAVHGPLRLAASLAPFLDQLPDTDRPVTHRRWVDGPRLPPLRTERRPLAAFRPHRTTRRRLLDAIVAERELRRELDRMACRLRHGDADHVDLVDSPAWQDAAPEVSAIVTVFDYADVVTEALDSLAASTGASTEIVVVDDHSGDDGVAVVSDWIRSRPDVPARLVARGSNGGLAAARNLAISQARTDRVMILDADNQVYPTCLRRLSDALDAHPDAALSWSILEVFGASTGLLSSVAWDPERLVERNIVDAQVMLRRSAWAEVGGYRQLPGMLLGWEDWDLWLRLVETGRRGVLVPEILGRYRAQEDSMVSGPNRFTDVMLERLEAAHPALDFPPR